MRISKNALSPLLLLSILIALPVPVLAGAAVMGLVRDRETGAPIAGAVVYLFSLAIDDEGQPWVPTRQEGRSDDKGQFRFADLSSPEIPGLFYLVCHKQGYVSYPPDHQLGGREWVALGSRVAPLGILSGGHPSFRVEEGQIARVEIVLDKGGSIEGRIVIRTAAGIVPFASGSIGLLRKPDPADPFRSVRALSVASTDPDAEGRFTFADLAPSDRYELLIRTSGFPSSVVDDIRVERNQVTSVERTLDRSDITGLRGTVRIGNALPYRGTVVMRPLPKPATPSAGGSCSSGIAADGTYSCLGVRPGQYEVEVVALTRALESASQKTTTVIQAGQTAVLDFDLPAPVAP